MSHLKLLWVLQHPTPYNIFMLNGLRERAGLEVEAVFRRSVLASHPWKGLPECRFPSRILEDEARRERDLEERALQDESTLFVFGGWRDQTILPQLLKRRAARAPYAIWTDTPKGGETVARHLLNAAFVAIADRACCVLGTGEPALERYEAMGVPRARLLSLPFVVDEERFRPCAETRGLRKGEPLRLLTIGRLVDSIKGQSVAIRALAAASGTVGGEGMELVIAGTGPDEGLLRTLAAQLGLADRVRFPGWVGFSDLPRLLSEVDALVIPSYWDPYPVVVLEAMAAGLPVLGSTACGSVRERVRDGVEGFRHAPGDLRMLARQIQALASSVELRRRMGEASLRESGRWGLDMACATVKRALGLASGAGAEA